MITRRRLLEAAGTSAALAGTGLLLPRVVCSQAQAALKLSPLLSEGTQAEAVLDALRDKQPLIKLSYRPPNYETPIEHFQTAITPNDVFFVRYHLPDIPEIDAKTWKLAVGGEGANSRAELTLDDLRSMPAFEVTAVNQCSGNRRGLFQPHVAGVEWGYGAMGCARWRGARLKDVLDRVGLKKEALEIVMDGADGPIVEKTPDFIKSLPIWKAVDETTLVAYEMNGAPLPHWNGFPARIVVPGWTGTYWMKHVTSINAISKPFDNFWVKTGYRIPTNRFPLVEHFASQMTDANEPITEMVVNSIITNLTPGQRVPVGRPFVVKGIAWDGGRGITGVDVSADGGQSWRSASLGTDYGRFSFRSFSQ